MRRHCHRAKLPHEADPYDLTSIRKIQLLGTKLLHAVGLDEDGENTFTALFDEVWDIVDDAPADTLVNTTAVIEEVLTTAFREASVQYQDWLKSVTPDGWRPSFLPPDAQVYKQVERLRENRDTLCAQKQALGYHEDSTNTTRRDKKRPHDDEDASN